MKKWLKNILVLFIPTCLILFFTLELIFRFVIPASERPDAYFDSANQIIKYDNKQVSGLYTLGLQAEIQGVWRINNKGWNSSVDYVLSDQSVVAVIGDSYVEGFQVDVDKRFVELTAQEIKNKYQVLAFGRAGAPLTQYLHMARYLKKQYHPDVYVINVVFNDFAQSVGRFNPTETYFLRCDVQGTKVNELSILPFEKVKYSFLKKSALIRYFYYNCRIGVLLSSFFRNQAGKEDIDYSYQLYYNNKNEIAQVISYTVKKLKEVVNDAKLVFILDAPRPCIYNEKHERCDDKILFDMFKEICQEQNVALINMENTFKKHYEMNQKRFEFEIDDHWNELGHQLVATELNRFIADSVGLN